MVKTFNGTVGMDLKDWSHYPKIWFLHLVDHATCYSVSCDIYTKRKEEIVKRIFQIWISIFGSAKKFLVDNGGELDNDKFRFLCENVNIRICTTSTAAESPWSNGIVERHNATLGFSVQKIMDDLKCDLSLEVLVGEHMTDDCEVLDAKLKSLENGKQIKFMNQSHSPARNVYPPDGY